MHLVVSPKSLLDRRIYVLHGRESFLPWSRDEYKWIKRRLGYFWGGRCVRRRHMVWNEISCNNIPIVIDILRIITVNVYIRIIMKRIVLPFMKRDLFQRERDHLHTPAATQFSSICERVTLADKIIWSFLHWEYDSTLAPDLSAISKGQC